MCYAVASLASKLDPLISKSMEWVTGKSLFFGTDIADYARAYPILRKLPEPVRDWLGYREELKHRKRYAVADPWKLWQLASEPAG